MENKWVSPNAIDREVERQEIIEAYHDLISELRIPHNAYNEALDAGSVLLDKMYALGKRAGAAEGRGGSK